MRAYRASTLAASRRFFSESTLKGEPPEILAPGGVRSADLETRIPQRFNGFGEKLVAVDIPNYRVVEKLGIGAQSRVFRARCMRTGKDYAVKIVKVLNPEDTSFIDLLRTEHAIGSAVDHPVIRKVYELRMLRRRLRVRGAILFMEYVDGPSLGDKDFSRPLNEILRIFREVAAGIHAMHRAGYVHADLKPTNILICSDESVKLIDLGQSAKIHEAKPRIQGTIDYMAPEQVQRGVLDERTDIFGLGATLHKILTGEHVLTDMNQTISMSSQSLAGKRVSDTHELAIEKLPSFLARLIQDCCQYDPADRIQSMSALIQRLDLARVIVSKRLHSPSPVEDDVPWDDEEDDVWDAVVDELDDLGIARDDDEIPG